MKLTLRNRLVIWASDKPWISRFFVERATRNDMKLAAEEFDKVVGGGLGPMYRRDGSLLIPPKVYSGIDRSVSMYSLGFEAPLDRADEPRTD